MAAFKVEQGPGFKILPQYQQKNAVRPKIQPEDLSEEQDYKTRMAAERAMLLQSLEESMHTTNETESGALNKPKTSASQLAARLISASSQLEVRSLMGDISKELISLRIAAANAKGAEATKLQAAIKRLEKVVDKALKKIDDLNHEDDLKLKKARADKNKQSALAEQLKNELHLTQKRRRGKENAFLRKIIGEEQKEQQQEMQDEMFPVQATGGALGGFGGIEVLDVAEALAEAGADAEAADAEMPSVDITV